MNVLTRTKRSILDGREDEWERLCTISTEELDKEIFAFAGSAIESIIQVALRIKQKLHRGESIEGINLHLRDELWLVAQDMLRPEVLERWWGRAFFVRIKCLPPAQQDRCLSDEGVEVACFEDGAWTKRLIGVDDMTPTQRNQVFERGSPGRIRSFGAQLAWIKSQERPAPVERVTLKADARRDGLVFGYMGQRAFVSKEIILAALKRLEQAK